MVSAVSASLWCNIQESRGHRRHIKDSMTTLLFLRNCKKVQAKKQRTPFVRRLPIHPSNTHMSHIYFASKPYTIPLSHHDQTNFFNEYPIDSRYPVLFLASATEITSFCSTFPSSRGNSLFALGFVSQSFDLFADVPDHFSFTQFCLCVFTLAGRIARW
jgi:hypothetical protein